MAGNLDIFLKEWKVLESQMRENGLEVREWEEKHVGEVEAEQLKVCRILRNYITHNPTDSFINRIDTKMIKWIKNFAKKINKNKKVIKVKSNKKTIKRKNKVANKDIKKINKKVAKDKLSKNKRVTTKRKNVSKQGNIKKRTKKSK